MELGNRDPNNHELSSVFSMIASRKHGSLDPFSQLKQLLFDKNSTEKFTIRKLKQNLVAVKVSRAVCVRE